MEHQHASEDAPGQPEQPGQPGQEQMYEEPPDDVSAGLPVNLDSLRDGPPGTKPFYPYSTLIRFAIKGSPNQKLLLEDIYYAIESRFPYFRTASSGWKNSVRHNLSLNPCFEKVARPLTDRGKGSYWTVNDSVDPRTGVHRVRAPKQSPHVNVTAAEAAAAIEGLPLPAPAPPPDAPPAGTRRRGRKAKAKDAPPTASASRSPSDADTDAFLADMPFEPPGGFPPDPFAGVPVPPPHAFDPAGGAPGPPFMMIPGPMPDLPIDGAGQVDWREAWARELANLREMTADAERNGYGPEWYRDHVFKVRTGMLMQILPPPPLPPLPPPETQPQ